MKTKQLYFVLLACLVLMGVGLVGIAYGTNKVLGSQATNLAKLKGDEQALEAQQNTLTKNKHDIAKYSQLNTIAENIVPQDKDQAEAVREIVALASDSGISKISSITFPTSTLGSTGAGEAAGSPKLTQLTRVPGITGVYDLQITLTQSADDAIPYSRFINFLGSLEQNRRTAQVSSISVSPNTNNPNNVAFTLVIDEFIKP